MNWTNATLTQALQDWPVNQGANYITNIPVHIQLGELRVIKDLNLDIFEVTDTSMTLQVGTNTIPKPAGLIALRTMRLGIVASTNFQAANEIAIGLAQGTSAAPASIAFNGVLGAAPVSIAVPTQITVSDPTAGNLSGGILVTITGLDLFSTPQTEVLASIAGASVQSINRYSQIGSITTQNGSAAQILQFGTAAVAQSNFGQTYPVYKRNYDYVSNYASIPGATGRSRYYAELDENTWLVSFAADMNYGVILRFIKRPPSIVTAGTTWLGNNVPDLLFLASLMEAEHYLKADDRFADLQGDYTSKLQIARIELRNIIRQGDYAPVKPAAAPVQG